MGWRGLLAGALGLAALQVVTANPGAAGRVGSLLSGVGDLARRFMSPGVPAFAKPAPSSGPTAGPVPGAPGFPGGQAFPGGPSIAGPTSPGIGPQSPIAGPGGSALSYPYPGRVPVTT